MWMRALWVLAILALGVLPTAAQEDDGPLAWVPADFAGMIRLDVSSTDTLTALNVATFAASFLQPQRIQFQPIQGLDSVIPLTLLDVEDASYAQDVLPWLGDEIILAYRSFGPDLQGDDRVLLLSTRDVLQSASSFSRILEAQDILQQEDYRGTTLYVADKTTIVFTPSAVLIGSRDAVKAILDVQAGDGARMIDQQAFQMTTQDIPERAVAYGYVEGEQVLPTLSVLLEGDESAMPILQGINEILSAYRDDIGLEQLILGNALDGVGFTLQADTLRQEAVHVHLKLYDDDYTADPVEADFDPTLLDLLPQSAMLVQSGSNAQGAAYDLLTVLPLANFASQVIGAFPVQPSTATTSGALTVPTAEDIEQVLGGLLATLNRQANFDLDHDLLQHLVGSYGVALLPRPNDPLPPLNIPYDLLLVAAVDDAEQALDGATRLVEILLALDELDTLDVEEMPFRIVRYNNDPVLWLGTVDQMLVVATGSALEQALDARRGDDRLVNRERWQKVSDDGIPHFYVDIPAMYGTFFPQLAGPQLQQIRQLGAQTEYLGDGLFQMRLTVTLPSQLS
jgi:hypothetical protein